MLYSSIQLLLYSSQFSDIIQTSILVHYDIVQPLNNLCNRSAFSDKSLCPVYWKNIKKIIKNLLYFTIAYYLFYYTIHQSDFLVLRFTQAYYFTILSTTLHWSTYTVYSIHQSDFLVLRFTITYYYTILSTSLYYCYYISHLLSTITYYFYYLYYRVIGSFGVLVH